MTTRDRKTNTPPEPTPEAEVDVTDLRTIIEFAVGVPGPIERHGHLNADTVHRNVLAVIGVFGDRPEVSVDADTQTGTVVADITDEQGAPAGRGVDAEFSWRYLP